MKGGVAYIYNDPEDALYEPCNAEKKTNYDKYLLKVALSWLPFCQTSLARSAIKNYFSGLDKDEIAIVGENYLKALSKLYNVPFNDFLDLIKKSRHNKDNRAVLEEVGGGKINPLLALADYMEMKERHRDKVAAKAWRKAGGEVDKTPKRKREWNMAVRLLHKPGQSNKFQNEFSEEVGINIEDFGMKALNGGEFAEVNYRLDFGTSGMSYYHFLRKILRISLSHDLNITDDFAARFKSASEGPQLILDFSPKKKPKKVDELVPVIVKEETASALTAVVERGLDSRPQRTKKNSSGSVGLEKLAEIIHRKDALRSRTAANERMKAAQRNLPVHGRNFNPRGRR